MRLHQPKPPPPLDQRPGVKNIALGACLMFVITATGVGLWFASRGATDPVRLNYAILLVLLAVGGLQLAVGLFQLIRFNSKEPEVPVYTETELQAIVLSMIQQCLGSDQVRDMPGTIQTRINQALHFDVNQNTLKSLVGQALDSKLDCLEEIKNLSGSMSVKARTAAVRLSCETAGGIVRWVGKTGHEPKSVMEVARVVGVAPKDAKRIWSVALERFEEELEDPSMLAKMNSEYSDTELEVIVLSMVHQSPIDDKATLDKTLAIIGSLLEAEDGIEFNVGSLEPLVEFALSDMPGNLETPSNLEAIKSLSKVMRPPARTAAIRLAYKAAGLFAGAVKDRSENELKTIVEVAQAVGIDRAGVDRIARGLKSNQPDAQSSTGGV